MFKKVIIILLSIFILMNAVSAIDSSNWTTADVGYETFKIPPKYENPYQSDFNMYEFDEDIHVFTIRYVNPNLMSLYGYYIEHHSQIKKVNVSGHDAVHFMGYNRYEETNNSVLWFSSGEEFYYITWNGTEITPEIKEVVKSASPSKYSHDEFYEILNDEYQNYKIVNSIESQRSDYPSSSSSGHHSFVTFGSGGVNIGVMS
ncbi:MAG: hypothetical protein U0L42_00270 [Methanobrevibacter sp.]|uniref:hypothetical protein n=1 Tax=Methanobrevibacter sp. TaxID=66852 RepID=UPI002E79169E|nr:hypothetical protein [Methanobrevibacter sp.]MEE0934083.1 hypothetical protein [Methanobrevibacter sp.]